MPPIALAVAASRAVPTYFAPIRIDQDEFVDGGVHSPTNAAVLAPLDLDVVIIVSPMSGPVTGYGVAANIRRYANLRLRREVRALRHSGHQVVVFEPGKQVQKAMGSDPFSSVPVVDVVREAFLDSARVTNESTVLQALRDNTFNSTQDLKLQSGR
jgi:NTE family protein